MDTRPYKQTRAMASRGIQDGLAMLAADHAEVSDLFDQFQEALENDDAITQKDLADEICDALEAHAELEEDIFYPACARHASLKPIVDEALEEHGQVKSAIARIRRLEPHDPDFASAMLELMEDVEHHVDEEESGLFPQVEKLMGNELGELSTQMQERKNDIMGAAGS